MDNFSTGHQHNLEEVKASVIPQQWTNFSFIEGDICNLEDCQQACLGVDYVLHQAALGSVPRSINDPINEIHKDIASSLQKSIEEIVKGISTYMSSKGKGSSL